MVCGVCLAMSATYFSLVSSFPSVLLPTSDLFAFEHSRFPKDRLWMKVLVAVLTVSAIIDTGKSFSSQSSSSERS
jgi:hypothetical protein